MSGGNSINNIFVVKLTHSPTLDFNSCHLSVSCCCYNDSKYSKTILKNATDLTVPGRFCIVKMDLKKFHYIQMSLTNREQKVGVFKENMRRRTVVVIVKKVISYK